VRYRKKPVVIEAEQLRWQNWNAVCELLGGVISEENPARMVRTYSDTCEEAGPEYIEVTLPTAEGAMIARHGDWIIRGVQGEVYPCKPDIFAATYEPA
jgi:hypothetical protein